MIKESKQDLKVLSVDGGASVNNYLMQFQADILNTTIRVPKVYETTSLGVCYLADFTLVSFHQLEQLPIHEYTRTYKPKMAEKEREDKYAGWKKAVRAVLTFSKEE